MKRTLALVVVALLLWCSFWCGHSLGMRDMASTGLNGLSLKATLANSIEESCQQDCAEKTAEVNRRIDAQQRDLFEAVAHASPMDIALAPIFAPIAAWDMSRIHQTPN